MASDFECDLQRIDWSGNFEQQVATVLQTVRLTRTEVDDLSNLFFDLQHTLQWAWPGCRVMPFGSIITGLGIRSSDVDCYVHIPEHQKPAQAKCVIKARNFLRKRQYLFKQPFAITQAKVPIVKFYYAPTGRQCDVSFKSEAGVRNSKLIACLLLMDPRALPLAILIKYWSKIHSLTGTNLLANYSLTLMTIFFLQHKHILPAVADMQKTAEGAILVEDWNTAFNENYFYKTSNTESLYELLGGFFKFYSTYKFDEYVISIFLGANIVRHQFASTHDVPDEFHSYKRMVGEGMEPIQLKNKPICVQDVFEHNRNCTGAVYPRLAQRIILHIQLAAKIFTESDATNCLKEILVQKPVIPKPAKAPKPDPPRVMINDTNVVQNPVEQASRLLDAIERTPNLKRTREEDSDVEIPMISDDHDGPAKRPKR